MWSLLAPPPFKAKKLVAYAKGIVGLKPQDVWLASFPKAGNTWLRFLLCNVISQLELDGRLVDFYLLDETMPALGASDLRLPWPYASMPRCVKTHQPYFSVLFACPQRAVYVLRDPRDVMVSGFHFWRARVGTRFTDDFSEFIRHPRLGLRPCIRHFLSWKDHCTCLVRYEALLQDTSAEFSRVLDSLGVSTSPKVIREAVERSKFGQVRSVQEKYGLSGKDRFDSSFRFARRGVPGEWQELFSGADLQWYRVLRSEFGYDHYP